MTMPSANARIIQNASRSKLLDRAFDTPLISIAPFRLVTMLERQVGGAFGLIMYISARVAEVLLVGKSTFILWPSIRLFDSISLGFTVAVVA